MKIVPKTTILTTFWLLSLTGVASAEQTKNINQQTGAVTWETAENGVYFGLTQLLPDQLRAFYGNRGFTQEQIKPYVESCVYMTVLRNDSASGDVHFVSNDWVVSSEGKQHQLKSVKTWLDELEKAQIKKPATIAFRWAQFPPEQTFQPGGDWNQGMLSIGLSAGAAFDVTATWDIEGKPFESRLTGVQCAK